MENAYERFVEGDERALLELIGEYREGLTMYLNSYVHDLNAADELCGEVFIRLVLKKPKFCGRSSFKTFLYGVGRNLALQYLRRNRNQKTVTFEDDLEIVSDANPVRAVLDDERKTALHRALAKIKREYAEVLWLTYFEELSIKEIARIMKKSPSAVKSLSHRARQALKAELEKEGFSYEDL